MIKIDQVSKTYISKKTAKTVLHPTSITIHDHEILGIVGKSGAGKSTLLRIINGLIKPTTGRVYHDNIDLFSLKQKDINRMRHQIGMVFQHFNLIGSLNAYDNIKLALDIAAYPKTELHQRIEELLLIVGLKDKALNYPNQLSGGEKQRLGIARAIANKPKVLLCDEATSALDVETANEIIHLLKTIHAKMNLTIIFISHQIEIVKELCSRVIVFEAGRLIEDQPIKALFTHPEHEKTKALIHSLTYEKPKDLVVYELIYDQKNSDELILSSLIKSFDVDVNILFAKTLKIQDEWIGYLYVSIFGKDLDKALDYLKQNGIEVQLYA